MQHSVTIGGELVTFDTEVTTIYMFPNHSEMNHVYSVKEDTAFVVRQCKGLEIALMSLGFPVFIQTYPRQSEFEAYEEWLSTMTTDLDEFEGFEG